MGVKWTEEQEKVIRLRNRNILVSAAAGSGKTAVLVERIITMLTKDDPPMDVDRLLIVTFTEAAASEMKERIRLAIEKKLMEKGVPENEIAFIHDANTELRKAELFGKVRSGQVRFLLGSTQKMGAGTNVQDRLIALHHLDVPWRPSDVGRILRTFKIKKNVEVTDNGKIII